MSDRAGELIDEGRSRLREANVYVAPAFDGSEADAIWSASIDPPFIVRRLVSGWGLDELATWTINHLGELLDEFEALRKREGNP